MVNIRDAKKSIKPFPCINSLIVTVNILSYVDIQDEVVSLLWTLNHGTRAYVADKEDDLSSWLITFPNNLTLREYGNLRDPTRQFYKEIYALR